LFGPHQKGDDNHIGLKRKNDEKDESGDSSRTHGRRGEHGPLGTPSASNGPLGAPLGSVLNPDELRHRDRGNRLKFREARRAKVKQIRERWGTDIVNAPGFKEELYQHFWRLARLKRMRALATEKNNGKLLSRIDQLEQKENERHEKAMDHLKAQTSNEKTASSAAPASSVVPNEMPHHVHDRAKKAHEGGLP
jgi:hypothetical protein